MTKNLILNSSALGVGGVMSAESGRLDSLIITIVYLVLVEVVKYLKARNPNKGTLQNLQQIENSNKIKNIFSKIFKNGGSNK